MRKASRILFLVSGIISIVTAVTFLVLGIVFAVLGSPACAEMVRQGILSGDIKTSVANVDEAVLVYQAVMIGNAVTFFIFMATSAVNIVMSFLARKKQTKAILILNIVFGVLSCVEINVVGAVFGLIANVRESHRESK